MESNNRRCVGNCFGFGLFNSADTEYMNIWGPVWAEQMGPRAETKVPTNRPKKLKVSKKTASSRTRK